MKHFLILIASLSFALTALAQSDSSLTGKWKLLMFKNLETGQMTDTSRLQDGIIAHYSGVRLSFKDSDNVGKIEGKSFCNYNQGRYQLYDKNKISITHFGGTMVWCLYEDKFGKAMLSASSYKRNSNRLCILYNNDKEEMVFLKDK